VISQRSRAMKHALAAIILALSLTAPVAAGPFEDATAAYDRGDYAVALRLFRPLANQGDPTRRPILALCTTLARACRRT
jgi:TPR repeat protein